MLKKLTNKVYYMPQYSATDRPALGLVCGDTFSVLVDSGNSPAHARDFLQLVENIDALPVKFVIITHWHWDHIFGMDTMELLSISHDLTKAKIQDLTTVAWDDASLDARVETGEEIEFCSSMIKLEMPTREYLKLKTPDLSFSSKMELDLGGITCVVEHVGGVHAPDSSIVYIPEEKIMFLGDCIYQDFYSGEWSYDLGELTILLDKIRKYDVDYYVTGHQEPMAHAELWHWMDELIRVGKIVGNEVSFDQAVARFNEHEQTKPTEEQLEYIQNFISGSQKKLCGNPKKL